MNNTFLSDAKYYICASNEEKIEICKVKAPVVDHFDIKL